ncbi:origin of replication complex subunit 3 isoform X1 [Nicotiana tabacum]|uniref:Origin recognition complex subunit 3 isoform X1 n=1 Tax=Nicotiana sylvestris TaxID=4096 RepID=A0A1U7VB57_NICSY|nr:PREDICTED: origin recognition complex subunit 3 isoform X1 [Nicotiana sylvestris]
MDSPNTDPLTDPFAENNLQPYFVLHKSSKSSESTAKSPGKSRKRRLDSSPKVSSTNENTSDDLKMEAFHCVWSKIESKIKDALTSINADVFDEIGQWVSESFDEICSCRGPVDPSTSSLPYPFVNNGGIVKKLFTGLVFTKNIETVDDILTFADLGLNLKSSGYHVANISSLDFSTKNGIGGCLRGLLRQLLMVDVEAAEMSLLASWYNDRGKYDNPVIVIIEDLERCSGTLLSDFINMLSEWAVKIPIILIAGVATSVDAPRNLLSSRALQHLSTSIFTLKSPAERMDAIIEAVLVKDCAGFSVGHKVATLLRNYFLKQEGTVTSFVRALKMAIVQQLSIEPLSFMLKFSVDDGDNKRSCSEELAKLPEALVKHAFDLPSYRTFSVQRRNKYVEPNVMTLAHGLSELQRVQKVWRSLLMCLHEAGRYHRVALMDLYWEALDPGLYNSRSSDNNLESAKGMSLLSNNHHHFRQQKADFTNQVIRKMRDLPAAKLSQLLKSWERLTDGTTEVHEKINELQFQMVSEDGKSRRAELTDISKRHINRRSLNACTSSEKAMTLATNLIRENMQPIECVPFHELVCFRDVDKLQSALVGDPRRRVQIDLLDFHKILKCGCCSKSVGTLVPSMHDTSIMYTLAQEHGDLINLHDWFQSFKAIISRSGKKGLKQLASPKKRKDSSSSQNNSDALSQARFCRAVMELQITGLLRMPSKRRPDYVQRVAFGV